MKEDPHDTGFGKRLKRIVQKVPNWSSLRTLGNNRLLRTSYIWPIVIPVIANLFRHVGPVIEVFLWNPDTPITIAVGLPFSWKVLYFSGIACALATATYSFRCPGIVADVKGVEDFRKGGSGPIILAWEVLYLTKRKSKSDKQRIDELNVYMKIFYRESEWHLVDDAPGWAGRFINWSLKAEMHPEKFGEAFYYVRASANNSEPLSRAVCSLFYAIACCLGLWIYVENFIVICRNL